MYKKLFLTVLLLSSLALAEPRTVGEMKFSTTGAGSGTFLEAYYLDINGPPRINLVLTWEGRGANRAEIDLTPAQIESLASVFEQALAASKAGKTGDFPVATAGGRTLMFQNQAGNGLRVTCLILKPPGKTQWKDWVVAQVNLEPKEEQAFRQLLSKMKAQF